MKEYVVDASVAMKWFATEVHSAAARRLVAPDTALYAPDFLLVEFANVIWKKSRRREITADEGQATVSALRAVPLDLRPSGDLVPVALKLAVELDHPIYDCVYLALAVALHCPVVTADNRFRVAAASTAFAPYVRWIEDAL